MIELQDRRKSEMTFFKDSKTFYASTLDECGDINRALNELKKKIAQKGEKLPTAKWLRLDKALRSGEIVRGKRCTPSDWAAMENKLSK